MEIFPTPIIEGKTKTLTSALITTLIVFYALTANAQVNKGILGYDNDSDAGYVRLRGNADNTIVYIGSIGDNGVDRNRGRLQLREADNNGSESRATLYLPSGRGQLVLDDSSNDLRVRLSSSLRDKGSSSNQSYGYLDLVAGSSNGESIAWLGASDSDPLQGQLQLRQATSTNSEIRARLFLPSGRGQLQLDDVSNDLRVRLSSSNRDKGSSNNKSYGYLDLMSGTNNDGDSIAWLGASDNTPERGQLNLYDTNGGSPETRATLSLPAGRGQLSLDDLDNDRRVLLSSSLNNKGASQNQSFGYLNLTSGAEAGNSIVWLGAFDSSPERGRLELRHSDDAKGRVEAFIGSNKKGYVQVKGDEGNTNLARLFGSDEGGELALRSNANRLTATLSSELDSGNECGVLLLENSNGDAISLNSCTGEKNAIFAHPQQPRQQIYYNAMEGPEIGLYTRGKAVLRKGKASIKLPEHFSLVVSEKGLTAQLTAHSIKSRGVAITKLSKNELSIAELGGDSTADYEVSFLVQGVRAGKEDYQVVRNRKSLSRSSGVAIANKEAVEADTLMVEDIKLERTKPSKEVVLPAEVIRSNQQISKNKAIRESEKD